MKAGAATTMSNSGPNRSRLSGVSRHRLRGGAPSKATVNEETNQSDMANPKVHFGDMDTNSFNSAGFVSQGFLNPAIINQNSDNIQSQQL